MHRSTRHILFGFLFLLLLICRCTDEDPVDGRTPVLGEYGEDYNNSVENIGSPIDPSTISSFPYSNITYYVEPLPASVNYNQEIFEREISAAVTEWSRALAEVGLVRNMVRVHDSMDAHWIFGFREKDHQTGCDAGFRVDHILAHCFTYSNGCLAGHVHFNSSVLFLFNGADIEGFFDLQTVALHEIGHLFGLKHNQEPTHIMSAGYHGLVRRLTEQEARDAMLAITGGGSQ